MAKKNKWNTVTTFSKITALVLFVMLPVIAFYLGVAYQEKIDSPLIHEKVWTKPEIEQKVCTMEVRLCPDGKTYVGRTGPNCEFAKCISGQD